MENLKATFKQFSASFKECALWSTSDSEFENGDHTIFDFSQDAEKNIKEIFIAFLALLTDEQKELFSNDPDNFGHWLCLEMQGHGSGFYDSEIEAVKDISAMLDENNFYSFEGVFIGHTNKVTFDLYKHGKFLNLD